MKLYRVEEGTVGTVYHPKPSKKRNYNWHVREQLDFADHEKIFCPVDLHNGKLKKVSRWCRSQAHKGLAGFRRKGYLLVVKYDDVNVLC